MSTTPTEVLETVASTSVDATEAGFDLEAIKGLMDNFDPASWMPELNTVFGWVVLVCRLAILVGPILLTILGIAYLFFSPKEANWYFGYRTYFGMGSVQAWRFTQRLSGIVLGGLGLILTGVMLVITGSFAEMETMDMLWKAIRCLAWEAGLALFATLFINFTVMICYDSRGQFRATQRKYKKK